MNAPMNQALEAENELICERLLGWKKLLKASPGVARGSWISGSNGTPGEYATTDQQPHAAIWQGPYEPGTGGSHGGMLTPAFDNWMDAGLILNAFAKMRIGYGLQRKDWNVLERGAVTVWLERKGLSVLDEYVGDSVPETVRQAALGWVKRTSDDTEF